MLSIIVPIYKTEKYLKRCIESLLNQDLKLCEIILVDDGSPDNSPRICDEYALRDERIRVIHKVNEGLGMARNSGLKIANGEYITFIDSDDYVDKDYLVKLYELAKKYDAEVCVSGGIYIEKEKRMSYKDCVSPELQDQFINGRDIIKQFSAKVVSPNRYGLDYCSLSVCFSLFKRSLFNDKKLSFVSECHFLSEDMEFNMELYQVCGSVYLSNVVGYHYCYNENSLSRGNKKDRFLLLIKTIEAIEMKFKHYRVTDEEYRIALYFWVNFEKCINQEVRYRKWYEFSISKYNIISMVQNNRSQKYLEMIRENRNMSKIQSLLCVLLLHERINLVIILLRIYNMLRK